jgi:superfamily II DNA or RNA helicase
MPQSFFSEEDLKQGQVLLQEGKIGELLFSGGTYQVEIRINKETFWPFLQISDEGKLKDHFCTCPVAEEGLSCPHQAAAWLKITHGNKIPLHVRFRESFWYELFQMAARRHGEDKSCLKGSVEAGYQAFSSTGKNLFSLKARTAEGKKMIKEIIAQRKPETEETSLKFSNLSPEELLLWKEGRPSPELSFELSFWSDLAKWCFREQEDQKTYAIEFEDGDKKLPYGLKVQFKDAFISFYIAEANWPLIIPTLSTVKSPLIVHEVSHKQIQRIFYDVLRKVFHLDILLHEETDIALNRKQIGEWIYVPGQGFYPSQIDPLLKEKMIPTSQIGEFLQRHHFLLKHHLQGTKIHDEKLSARYHLSFDDEHNLHLTCYVFEKGDLQKLNAAKFGSWVFLPDKGFFLLEDILFEETHAIIPKEEVSHFVSRHRHWLSSYEGFETHVISIEARLGYELALEGLEFTAQLDITESPEDMIDFHEWVYVRGRGFYAKDRARTGSFLKPGLKIARPEVNAFIKAHRDELEAVSRFFTTSSPLLSSGVKVVLNLDQKITVSPSYTYAAGYEEKQVELFEDFTFVKGEGFCDIPSQMKLPSPYFRTIVIDEAAEPYFVGYEIDTLKPFILSIDPKLQKPDHLELQMKSLQRDEDGSWLVDLSYVTNLGALATIDVWEALNDNKRHLFSPAGLILLKTPRFNWLRGITKKRWLKKGEQLRLTTIEWIRLFAFEQMSAPIDDEGKQLWKQFHEMQVPDAPKLEGLQSRLRPYQQAGLHWLWFLHSYGLSGLLCDEMGLGKTHQAMALLAAVSHVNHEGKYLVVCPTSVIFHWQDLLERFLPRLRVLVYYGATRTLEDFKENYDLLLTSYGTLRSEKETLSDHQFNIAIFDEIQTAKNHLSQTHKVLKKLSAKTRIGLTGTPIENNLLELKALFDVVLPGYMPTETVYKELFVNPIEKQQDQERKKLLSRLIEPFLLRRKKSDVLLELPEKVETISYAPLSDEQKKLYQEVFDASREDLYKELSDSSKPVPYMHVFALLTKLKQICDHPALYLNKTADYTHHASGKWDLFTELLQETRASGQKLVVFSQYLGMLDIIESYLKSEKIGYSAIRGSTRDRKEQVIRFRDDPQCEVFVGSLQAAGVGIDLISASVVIHYDRWWNPAKENQATDRVHRMGQSRGVQVFKLVTRGTLEEHIHRLIEKKLTLIEDVIGYDDQSELKTLSRDELIQLLQVIEESSV